VNCFVEPISRHGSIASRSPCLSTRFLHLGMPLSLASCYSAPRDGMLTSSTGPSVLSAPPSDFCAHFVDSGRCS